MKKTKTKKSIISPFALKDLNIMNKIKLVELVGSVEALNKLAETKLPASVAFSLGKFLKEITTDVDTFNKVKMDKASQYGDPVLDKDGNKTDQVTFSKDGKLTEGGEKFVAEMKEIENKEIEVKIRA